jgi:hypothetical protein
MKKIVFIGILCLSLGLLKAHAQSGFIESRYYQEQYSISDIPVDRPYYKYNYYGQAIGIFQHWEYAQWNSDTGGSYTYVWNGSAWEYVYYTGTYYWFNWVVYEKQIE